MIPVSLRPLAMIMVLTTLITAWRSLTWRTSVPSSVAPTTTRREISRVRMARGALALKGHVRSMNNIAIIYTYGNGTATLRLLQAPWWGPAGTIG